MTTRVVGDDVLGVLAKRQNELFRRVQQGTLPANEVLRNLQNLIEGRLFSPREALPFADEEVESNFGYPEGFQIRSVKEQVETLLSLEPFKHLDASHVEDLAGGKLPGGAEGWAVIPKSLQVAKGYHEALELALRMLVADRRFQNWREGELTEKHLRLTEKKANAHAKLDEQPGDFWVFPFQFGLRHRGRSVRRARALFTQSEFGLGAYEAAVLLLTHPDRITGPGQLYVDCAGVEYSPDAAGDFFSCLYFYWDYSYELLELYDDGTDLVGKQWGSCSGFVAQ
jgi:hypothetical protein